ncbi:carboxypeptidase regulatory-like domain-containing protein [Silvibacterium acidisoli]|uniref:carboxypeptidase regulatory-like domain-containing protein n=1 Tax=Acidobacteriaceae bacterium ZG23-2 TaxID=2883246 RepID=UPI00406CB9E5
MKFLSAAQRSRAALLALSSLLLAPTVVFFPFHAAYSQATNLSGSIQGTITDPGGAVVPNATVTITGVDTNVTKTTRTDGAGAYASGPLVNGNYRITVDAPGFAQLKATTVVQIGTTANGNYKLTVGSAAQVVEITGSAIQIDSSQTMVSSVVTPEQIKNLPVQGRNFLDLAQLEPGVQLQSGESFDPTKAGYSALSIGGVSGRTTRILLDGSDVTDETVGTTIFNVPSGAVGEFQLTRSTGDASSAITSSGSLNVSTPTGTNKFHGQTFYTFQDNAVAFADAPNGIDAPFQRNQFGGNIGGPILKDKLFFFADSERIKQDSQQVVTLGSQFADINAANPTYGSPFRDTYSVGRIDYNGRWGIHYFVRGNYESNSVASTYGYGYSLYANRDNTPGIAYGVDFVTGNFTHSFRGGYEKFHNLIGDLTASNAGLYNPLPGIEINAPGGLFTGPNLLAPQQTYQSDKQFRYDGSWTHGPHVLRYGAGFNRILGGGFASFYGLAPLVSTSQSTVEPGVTGAAGDPTTYSAAAVTLGNGQGYDTEIPSFGKPAGGQGDWRLDMYIADTWKITPNLTLNSGVLFQRDTGRSNSDVAPIPCSEIDTTATGFAAPCSGNQLIMDQFGPGLGDRVRQPFGAFGPQLGLAYAPPTLHGDTVLRAAAGLYFENFVFNNTLFDRPFKLQKGLFFQTADICGGINTLTLPGQGAVTSFNGVPISTLCSEPLSQSAAAFTGLQQEFQAATALVGAQSNGSFIGNTLAIPASAGYDAYAPHNFATPRSFHSNFGIQQKLFNGGVLTVDYLHQVDWKFQEALDVNHVGAARYFNPAAAQAAISATLAACGSASIDIAIASCPGLHTDSDTGQVTGATITDFAANGLDSGVAINGGYPSPGNIAFGGANPNVGQGQFQYPMGRSAYDALQVSFRGQKANPFKGVVAGNLEVSYAYSRFVTNVGNNASASNVNGNSTSDQYFTPVVWDADHPTRNIGPGTLDRPQQLSFGGYLTMAQPGAMHRFSAGPTVGIIAHFSSSPPNSLTLDNLSGASAQIFQTDINGDGQTGDLLPNSEPGAYGRSVHPGSLNKTITAFNNSYAGTLTPAGKAVVGSGLMTTAQLAKLGGVVQAIGTAQSTPLNYGNLKEIDANFSYPIKLPFISESASIEPAVAFYNVANFANFSGGPSTILTDANDNAGNSYVNTASGASDRNQYRTGRGSGTFNLGGPRTSEFSLKFNF